MNIDSGELSAQAHGPVRDFERLVKARQEKLKGLSDAEFINWDKALLACPQPGSSAEDKDFAILNVAMGCERRRRRDRHNGVFGWRRLLTPADRDVWLEYYRKAAETDSKRTDKDSAGGRQVPN
jgi:hypothetical protein